MSLPTIVLFVGRAKDIVLEGPGTADFDFDDYDDVRLVCTALGITKTLSVGAAEMEKTASGANLVAHVLSADMTSKTPGWYTYQVEVKEGSQWHDLAEKGAVRVESVA